MKGIGIPCLFGSGCITRSWGGYELVCTFTDCKSNLWP